MNFSLNSRRGIIIWQLLFILLSTSWLWAPGLNHLLSTRTSLISQYENSSQPYALWFRISDALGACFLLFIASVYHRQPNRRIACYLLLIIGAGMLIDPIMATSCQVRLRNCVEYFSPIFVVHAVETIITGVVGFAIGVYDSWLRRRVVSLLFVAFQIGYFLLFLSQLASENRFNTLSQFFYQLVLIIWLAWYCQDYLINKESLPSRKELQVVKYAAAAWAFLNGVFAIIISLAHLNFGLTKAFYFAGDNAWLAEHRVIIGIIMLYLSRQIARGEMRARQIFLVIVGIETLKYSVISPNIPLMLLYLVTFCLVFVFRDDFYRGSIAMTYKGKLKDALFVTASLMITAFAAFLLLQRNPNISAVATQSVDHFFDYVLGSEDIPRSHLQSVLLAHTVTAFLVGSIVLILWILFRPTKKPAAAPLDYKKVEELINKYANSSEDYFKLWPKDKDYFWSSDQDGFIAYKITGPIAFALADPICPAQLKPQLMENFITWCRSHRLKICFMPIFNDPQMYKAAGLNTLQIGASAIIEMDGYLQNTARDKWWRWQKDRAIKSDYEYAVSLPPHPANLVTQFRRVSNSWLRKGGHEERTFALGYFQKNYIQDCPVHYLKDAKGKIVAFANQLPTFNNSSTVSVDLIRYLPKADNSMPYLLFKTIEDLHGKGFQYFDLGFVPFTSSKDTVVAIAKVLSAGRFSAKGLEQFKNKFDPQWKPNYLAYDGDIGDLALITVNFERLMSLD